MGPKKISNLIRNAPWSQIDKNKTALRSHVYGLERKRVHKHINTKTHMDMMYILHFNVIRLSCEKGCFILC